MMIDVATITVAIISLLGALGAAFATGWLAFFADKRKAERDAESLIRKYRDPLLLAAQDLQSRLFSILDGHVLGWVHGSPEQQDTLFIYTAFLVGQYFSWMHILRRESQFMCFATEEQSQTKKLIKTRDEIREVLSNDKRGLAEAPFNLWRSHQIAIGELMSVREDGELLCMGFSTFTRKWKNAGAATSSLRCHTCQDHIRSGSHDNHPQPPSHEESQPHLPSPPTSTTTAAPTTTSLDTDIEFRKWFRPVEQGLLEIASARQRGDGRAEYRLRRLQHLLLELAHVLDPKGLRIDAERSEPCRAPEDLECPCEKCPKGKKDREKEKRKKDEAKKSKRNQDREVV